MKPLRSVCLGGFLYGATFYGMVLSLVHVLHNELGSTRDALVTFVVFALLYGLWAMVFFAGAYLVVRLVSLLRRRTPAPAAGEESMRRSMLLGLFVFNFVFWTAFFLYGITYEEVPIGHPSGPAGMLGYVALVSVLVALGSALASWLLARLFALLGKRRWLAPAAVTALLLGLVVHAAAPLYSGYAGRPEEKAGDPAELEIPTAETGLKVVLVAFDGADWRVIRPLMDEGELPTFAGMVRQGATGPLATIHDSNSAVIWASIYSGTTPERHGILDFYRVELPGMASAGLFPVHRSYFKELADLAGKIGLARQTLVTRFSQRTAPLWEIADHAGLSTGVVDGYLYSVPAMKPTNPESFFLSYGLDGFSKLPGGKSLKNAEVFAQPHQLFRQVRPLLDQDDFYWQSAVLFEMLRRSPQPRFLNFYTHEPDSFQHWYWKWLQPQYFLGVTDKGLEENGDRIPKLHRDFDAFLRRLLATVGPDTVVIVASDHGHAPTILHGNFYSQHRHGPPGIFLMQGGPVRQGVALQGKDIYDVFPTVLYLLGLPVPRDIPGQPMLDALDPEFVRRHPVRVIDSYAPLGLPTSLVGAEGRGDELNRQEIEKLKSLGYL